MKKCFTLAAMVTLAFFSVSGSLSGAAVAGKSSCGDGQPRESAAELKRPSKLVSHRRGRMGTPLRSYVSHACQSEVELVSKIGVVTLEHPSKGEMSDCQTVCDEATDYHNKGIELLTEVAKGLDKGGESCNDLKQSTKVLNEAEKALNKCWKKVKAGIIVYTPDYDTDHLAKVGNAYDESMKTVENFRAELKRRATFTCK